MKPVLIVAIALLVSSAQCQNTNRTSTPPVSGFVDYGTVGFPLRGCAVFAGTLNPVSGMTVEILVGDGTRIASTTTDAKGRVLLS